MIWAIVIFRACKVDSNSKSIFNNIYKTNNFFMTVNSDEELPVLMDVEIGQRV